MNQEIKNKVLQEIIDMMEERMVSSLKSKSPKFAKVEVAAKNPEDLEAGLEKAQELIESEEPSEDQDDLKRLKDLKR